MAKFPDYKRLRYISSDISNAITHLPDGYKFWHTFSNKRRQKIKRAWTNQIHTYLFDLTFKKAMLNTILDERGAPVEGNEVLYKWTVDFVYGGAERKVYEEWLKINTQYPINT